MAATRRKKPKVKVPNRVGTFRHLGEKKVRIIADNLRRIRTDAGLSLIKLSELTDPKMSFITISKLENEHAEPRLVSLINLARALKVELADLLEGV